MSCDGNCMRSYHIGMKDTDSEETEPEPDEPPCNPMLMPEDLAARLDVSPKTQKMQQPKNSLLHFKLGQ